MSVTLLLLEPGFIIFYLFREGVQKSLTFFFLSLLRCIACVRGIRLIILGFFLSFSLLGIPILVRRDRRLDMTLDLDFGSLDLLISREN